MLTGLLSIIPEPIGVLVGLLVAVATVGPLLARFLIVNVQEWEYGYFLRFGKPVIVKKTSLVKLAPPGRVYVVIPLLRQIKVISTQETPLDPVGQQATTRDGYVVTVNLTANYRRLVDEDSMTQSIIRIENLPLMVHNLVTDALVRVVSNTDYQEVVNTDHLVTRVLAACSPAAQEKIGVNVVSIGLQTLAKTNAQLNLDGHRAIADAIRQSTGK